MKISTKGEYGLLAMVDLGLQPGHAPVQAYQIATRQGIPKQYLDQLMLTLKKAGLVASLRGRQGGYQLARPASTITLLDVVTALEGSPDNASFSEKRRRRYPARIVLHEVWRELTAQSVALLGSKTIADICAQCQQSAAALTWEI